MHPYFELDYILPIKAFLCFEYETNHFGCPIFSCQYITNNGAENYHYRLKKDIVVSHPRVCFFVEILNKTIQDTNLDIERLGKGINITRNRKLKDIQNDSFRTQSKEKLLSGEYSPTQNMDAIASSIHPDTNPISLLGDCPDESLLDEEPEDDIQVNCCVCLLQRVTTVLFLPCRHAKCCEKCSASLEQCPLCRCNIEQRFNMFT